MDDQKPNSISISDLADSYTDRPSIRALLGLVTGIIPFGIGSAIDAYLVTNIENIRQGRLRAFFDELQKGEHYLTPELINEEDFIHAFVSTYTVAMRTRHRDKIRQFAQMLLTATREKNLNGSELEEFSAILEDLSPRELKILLLLQKFEVAYPHQLIEHEGQEPYLENDLQRASRFWQSFAIEVERNYALSSEMLAPILTRLNRTGLYETFAGSYLDYTGGKGQITPLFTEFTRWLEAEDAKFES